MEFRETLLAAQRNQQEKASVVSFDFHFATYRGLNYAKVLHYWYRLVGVAKVHLQE